LRREAVAEMQKRQRHGRNANSGAVALPSDDPTNKDYLPRSDNRELVSGKKDK
jgi:hypothetical protein